MWLHAQNRIIKQLTFLVFVPLQCIAAAQQGNYAVGYELNPWLVWYSRWRAFVSGVRGQAKFFRKDLWKVGSYRAS